MFRLSVILLLSLSFTTPLYAGGGGLLKACFSIFSSPKSAVELEIVAKEERAWTSLRPQIALEMAKYRALPKEQKRPYLESVSSDVMMLLQEAFNTDNIGFHYNLHGGVRESYVTGGGIRATQGDIATLLGHARDFSQKVYFFQSKEVSLLQVLDTANPNFLFPRMRMGNVLMLIDLNAPIMKRLEADGVIINKREILFEVDASSPHAIKNREGSLIGVPAEAFALPPLHVFSGVAKKSGLGKVNWEEQTLVTMRFLEQMARDSKEAHRQ